MTTDEMKEMRNMFGEKPTTGLREKARPTFTLGPEGKTCKSCKHAVRREGGNSTFFKCLLNRARWTGGLATDIRLKDPACGLYEAED